MNLSNSLKFLNSFRSSIFMNGIISAISVIFYLIILFKNSLTPINGFLILSQIVLLLSIFLQNRNTFFF